MAAHARGASATPPLPAESAGRDWVAVARAIVEALPDPAVLLQADGAVAAHSGGGAGLAEVFRGQENPSVIALIAEAARSGTPRRMHVTLHDSGAPQLLELTATPLQNGLVLCLGRDLTVDRKVLQALAQSREMFRDLIACSSDFAFEVGADGRFRYVSPRGALGFGAWELVGRDSADFKSKYQGAEAADQPLERPWPFTARVALETAEAWLQHKDGSTGCYEVSCLPVKDAAGAFDSVRGVARDVTETRYRDSALLEAHARLERISRLDELTGLLNRRAFEAALRPRLAHLRRHGRTAALLYLDLDNFKAINDAHGHQQGDTVLRAFSDRLNHQLRAGDAAARLGGDEFALWLEEVTPEGARVIAQRLLAMGADLDREFGVPGRPLGLSIGIALSNPADAEAGDRLIARADAAMYEAKRGGKNRSHVSSSPTDIRTPA